MKAKKVKKLKCGDVIKVPAGFKKALSAINERGKEMFRGAETFMRKHHDAEESFWVEIHKKYPETNEHRLTYNHDDGEIIIIKEKNTPAKLSELLDTLTGDGGWRPTTTKED